jgi:hypothetical protein
MKWPSGYCVPMAMIGRGTWSTASMCTPRILGLALAHSRNNAAQHWWQAALALFNLAHSRAQRFGSKFLKVRA